MQKELNELYKKWLNDVEDKCPEFLSDNYSNPYFVSIPDGWVNAKHKIMIVGEEGYGKWGYGKADGWAASDIEKIQQYNYDAVTQIIERGSDRRKFWQRFIKIYNLGFPCIWNNIDKIHYLQKRKGSFKLTYEERLLLHSTEIKILKEEIEILKPDVVVFFGWYGASLAKELPAIYAMLYPDGNEDLWKNSFYKITDNNINYIFTYHPSWRRKPANYEAEVLDCVESCLT